MRLRELVMERYGAFERRTLSLPPGPGLTVVYGPNEAGKSTCLSAIGDFLFGVPMQSPHGAVFGYDALRLTGRVASASGEEVSLSCRKGRGVTPSGAVGSASEAARIAALLGSMTRERFETLFGLNHHTLREGGEHLLEGDGDIGRLIVEAGGGLRSLMARLDMAAAEAGELFATRRSGRVEFYRALDAWTEAHQAARTASVSREAYADAAETLSAAVETLARLRERKRDQSEAALKAERLVRVAPSLRELERLDAELANLEDAANLRPDFDRAVAAVLADRRRRREVLETARTELAELAATVAALAPPPALIEAEPAIRDLQNQAVVVAEQRKDRANRERELAEVRARLTDIKTAVGVASDADLAQAVPPAAALDKVRALAGRAQALIAAIAAARRQERDIEARCAALQAAAASARAAGQDRPFGVAASELASLPALFAAVEMKRRRAEAAGEAARAALARAGVASATELEAIACPGPESITSERREREALEAALLRLKTELKAAEAAREGALAAIALLEAGGPVPTESALAEVRRERNLAWEQVRAGYVGGAPEPAEQRALAAERLDGGLQAADVLADRRTREAERIARLEQAQDARLEADEAIARLRGQIAQTQSSLDARLATFARSFAALAARAADLAAVEVFLDRRADALARAVEARTLAAEQEDAATALAPTMELLALALAQARISPNSRPLAAQVRAALAEIEAHDRARASHLRDLEALAGLERDLARAREEIEQAQAGQAAWTAAWGKATAAIRLAPDADVDDAGRVATLWAAARGDLTAVELTVRRLEGMAQDETLLRQAVAALGPQLGLNLPDDPVAAVGALHDAWSAAERTRQQRAALLPGLEALQARVAAAEATLAAAQIAVVELADHAGCGADDASLETIRARAARRDSLLAERAQVSGGVSAAGDGLPMSVLAEALREKDPDALAAEAALAREALRETDAAIEAAVGEKTRCEARLAQFEGDAGFNRAAAERESATARMHDTLGRWLELTLAHEATTRAIAKVRAERQAPLVRRASELFAPATRGSFARILTEVDDRGQPVVIGERLDGRQVRVAQMSDGTRDQLFLAFRLASVEAYCQAAEPLPFIADDILVHFDDARGAAALDLLADFGATTQVLLFTHHAGVREAAATLGGRAQVVELA